MSTIQSYTKVKSPNSYISLTEKEVIMQQKVAGQDEEIILHIGFAVVLTSKDIKHSMTFIIIINIL